MGHREIAKELRLLEENICKNRVDHDSLMHIVRVLSRNFDELVEENKALSADLLVCEDNIDFLARVKLELTDRVEFLESILLPPKLGK